MRKFLAFLLLTLMCVGGWADNVGPFNFTNWVYNSYTRVGGTEGTATYVCNAPIFMEQKEVVITNTGDFTISFQYTNGGKRLELYGVELIGSESSYTNYQYQYAGSGAAKKYTLSNVTPGTYTLRIWSSQYGDGNANLLGGGTNGNITYSGDAASGVNLTITSWSKDTWLKGGAVVPTDVISTINSKGWKSYDNIHYYDDENLSFAEAKTYNINYNYVSGDGNGNERMDIRGVEILDASGNVVSCDYHEGYTGNAASNRDYKVYIPAGTYTVRTLVQTSNANNVKCKGNITYSVIDGSVIATNYTTNIKPNLYDNGVLKIGAPVQSLLTALETAIEGGNDLAIEAAYNAAMTTKNINLPTGYYRMYNFKSDKSTLYYAYNDYNHTGNTNHYTLMSTDAVNTNNGLWHITNNGTNITIQNGDGQPLVYDTNQKTTLNFGEFKIDYFKNYSGGIYFTEGVHGTDQSKFSLADGTRRATTWQYTTSEGSRWAFEPVENPNIYNVVVTGVDAYVTLNGTNGYAYNGGFFNAASITESDLTAQNITGYASSIVVNESTKTITVNYTETYTGNHPYLVFKCERGGIVANANGNLTTAAYDATADNQKFLLVNIEDKDYLYSPTLQKFVTSPASGNVFTLVNYPHHAYTTADAANPSGNYTTILKINDQYMNNNNYGSMVNGWNDEDPGNRFQINEVGGISDEEYATLVADIKALCDAKKADMKTANDTYGTALGEYQWADYTATTEAVTASQALNTEAANYYTSLFAEIRKFDIAYQPTLNMPQDGTFLRMKSKVNGNYITINPNHNTGTSLQTIATASADNIFRYTEGKLLVYTTGMYVNNNNHAHPTYSSTVTFSEATYTGTKGVYAIKSGNGNPWYDSGAGRNIDNYGNAAHANCEWILEEVPYMYAVTINDGDENACVQTSDNVQVKNGGYLYVADGTAEVTYTPATEGYVANYEQDDEAKTITVTYTEEEEPAELADGYFYIKNAATGNYLVNTFATESATSTTVLASKETRNNGVWKVTCNKDEEGNVTSINLVNGIGTSINVGATSYNTLNIGNNAGSIFFTEGLDGTGDNLTAGADDAASSRWILEAVNNDPYFITVDIYKGDANSYVTLQKNTPANIQYALNNGFFVTLEKKYVDNGTNSLSRDGEYQYPTVADVSKELYTNYKQIEGKNYIQEYCFVIDDDVQDLQSMLNFAVEKILKHEIGYPKFDRDIVTEEDLWQYYMAQQEIDDKEPMFMLISYTKMGFGIQKSLFPEILAAYNIVTQIDDINLPTPGNFYIFEDNAKVKKTYYLTENSELLCYDNGQFAQIADNLTTVGYAKVGTEVGEGETFDFMSARTDEKGKPIDFGKVMAWQLGDAPLPSGDGHIYSGWTITKQPAPAIKMNTVASDPNFYTTLYMPQPVIIPEGVIAYSATVEDDKFILHEVATAGQTLAANTPVILSGAQGTEITIATSDEGAKSAESNDLKGTITTMPQAEGTTYYVLSGQGGKIAFYKYNEGNNLKGFKVYYDGTAGSGNSNNFEFVIAGNDDLTGIGSTTVNAANTLIRDLNGNIIANPIKGQIYIQNGKAIKY